MRMADFIYEDLIFLCLDKSKLHDWLWEKDMIYDLRGVQCWKCVKGTFGLRSDTSRKSDGCVWRCSNKECHKKVSIRKDRWFAGSHLKIEQILKLTYLWVYKTEREFIKREVRIGSKHSVVHWRNFCREVCETVLMNESEKIGGPGVQVEIDESKFGKRKYHRGRRVDGVWVFGGIEKSVENPGMFLTSVTDRSARTLVPIIKNWVKPGTTIHHDCWKAYDRLEEEGYTSLKVNHSIEFKSAEGACTNRIESTWRAVKQSLGKSGTRKCLYDSYFGEYIIRKKYMDGCPDKFLKFLEIVTKVYRPDIEKLMAAEGEREEEVQHEEEVEMRDEVNDEDKENEEPSEAFDTSADLFD